MLASLLQPEKASFPMLVTLSGIMMLVRLLQFMKVHSPILVTLPWIVMLDYIQLAKIDEAKVLLLYTKKSISEISSYLAFSSQSYFSSIFKKHTGYTPSEYQKSSPTQIERAG